MVTKKKILIVEDDHLIATIFRMFIKELNYDLIDILSNSEDAIKKIPALKPDIILMDILINGQQDGIEVSEFITKEIDVPMAAPSAPYLTIKPNVIIKLTANMAAAYSDDLPSRP